MCSHGEEDSMLFLGNHTLCLRCDHIRIKIVKERYEKFEEISGKKKNTMIYRKYSTIWY
jgi:hypothetical protein